MSSAGSFATILSLRWVELLSILSYRDVQYPLAMTGRLQEYRWVGYTSKRLMFAHVGPRLLFDMQLLKLARQLGFYK